MADTTGEIRWRLYLGAPPERVYELLSTDRGRAGFWAEETRQDGERLEFRFPDGQVLASRVLTSAPPRRFALTYFHGSCVTFELHPASPGTDLVLIETGVPGEEWAENRAGWVSVLLNLKALADHGVDLRNHDPRRTWSGGYVDN
jgi:uncharacterized protein YndB with AHSA1/START domain